jgi:hypothetical protein
MMVMTLLRCCSVVVDLVDVVVVVVRLLLLKLLFVVRLFTFVIVGGIW